MLEKAELKAKSAKTLSEGEEAITSVCGKILMSNYDQSCLEQKKTEKKTKPKSMNRNKNKKQKKKKNIKVTTRSKNKDARKLSGFLLYKILFL